MKVYVIKNKEGKYLCENARKNYWTDDFEEATIIRENEMESYLVSGKRNFFVECTLAEGDLEKELAVRDKALRRCFTCGVGFIEGMYERALDEARKELEDKDE